MNKGQMLVITYAEVELINREEWYYDFIKNGPSSGYSDQAARVERELVEGKVFINSRGERICLGLTSEVSKALRFPFELLEQNAKEIHSRSVKMVFMKDKIKAFESMNWIQRLKFLFTRELPV